MFHTLVLHQSYHFERGTFFQKSIVKFIHISRGERKRLSQKFNQSFETNMVVRVGPQQYILKDGVLSELPEMLKKEGIQSVLIVHGTISWQKAEPFLQSLFASDVKVDQHFHKGECSEETINALGAKLLAGKYDAVIAGGGGKIMDLVKYAAYRADHLPYLAIPTIASNCAPWTPVSVLYHEDGSFERLDVLPLQALYLLIEPKLIFDAPREYFIAGMGDTLAKWYESDAILSQEGLLNRPMLQMAQVAAAQCRSTILEKGTQALADLDQGVLSADFLAVAEVIISISGLVGGFGDALARTTIAHEVHDALTVHPETHVFLHGSLVGYGILVQLAVEMKWQEIDALMDFYRPLGIPCSLADMKLAHLNQEQKMALALQATKPELPVHNLPYFIDAAIIVKAIDDLENIAYNRFTSIDERG